MATVPAVADSGEFDRGRSDRRTETEDQTMPSAVITLRISPGDTTQNRSRRRAMESPRSLEGCAGGCARKAGMKRQMIARNRISSIRDNHNVAGRPSWRSDPEPREI